MAERWIITKRHDGEKHEGKGPQSIARRLYGRRALCEFGELVSPGESDFWFGTITRPADKNTRHVCAEVTIQKVTEG